MREDVLEPPCGVTGGARPPSTDLSTSAWRHACDDLPNRGLPDTPSWSACRAPVLGSYGPSGMKQRRVTRVTQPTMVTATTLAGLTDGADAGAAQQTDRSSRKSQKRIKCRVVNMAGFPCSDEGIILIVDPSSWRRDGTINETIRVIYAATADPRETGAWLNQVECWFSVLARRFLNRASFSSLQDLETRLKEFIRYFNAVLAKPYKWTYKGRPLQTGA